MATPEHPLDNPSGPSDLTELGSRPIPHAIISVGRAIPVGEAGVVVRSVMTAATTAIAQTDSRALVPGKPSKSRTAHDVTPYSAHPGMKSDGDFRKDLGAVDPALVPVLESIFGALGSNEEVCKIFAGLGRLERQLIAYALTLRVFRFSDDRNLKWKIIPDTLMRANDTVTLETEDGKTRQVDLADLFDMLKAPSPSPET